MSILDTVKQEYINAKVTPVMSALKGAKEDLSFISEPKQLSEYTGCIKALSTVKTSVEKLDFELKAEDLKPKLEEKFAAEIYKWEEAEVEINTKYEDMLDNRITSLEDEAKETNKRKISEFNAANKVYLDLEMQRKQLESYSDEIISICSEYGITTADVDIDNSSFTVEELSGIYDKYLSFIRSREAGHNIVTAFRAKVPNIYAQAAVLLILLITALTPLLDIFALVFFIMSVRTQLRAKSQAKSLIVLYGLVFNVHPLEMGFKGEIDESELVSEEINEDEDSRLDDVANQWQSAIEEHAKSNPSEALEEERVALASQLSAIQGDFDVKHKSFLELKVGLLDSIIQRLEDTTKNFEEAKSKVKLLGQEVTNSSVFNTKFKLGIKDGIIEEAYDMKLRNIIINPSEDEELHKQFLQVLLANAICNVKATNLTVIIYDPNRQGQELISFYSQDIEQLLIFSNETLEKIVGDLKAFAETNLKEMKGMKITEFNQEAEKVGKTPREYRLLIVLSQPKKIEEDEALSEFMSYSAELGVLVWLVSKKTLPNTLVFKKPFENVKNPYKIDTRTFGPMVADTLAKAVESSKSDSLTWKKFCDVAAPDDKVWSRIADNEVEIMPGFIEGDPTQYKGFTFGNQGVVHMIGVGGTGAGKSVFLNFVVCELTKLYSPRDLELWMIDFKGNEFVKYLSKPGHPAMLPHLKACLCTSDGDYAGSVFTALRKVTEDRFKRMSDLGYKNLLQYNSAMRSEGRLDEVEPRILCINDEFQVIFQKAEDKIVEQIKNDITYISKLGRAAGVHLFFTSQSMKGTLSDDVLNQFSLRFALRCDEEVSMSVLGNRAASEIKQKNGYLYGKSFVDKVQRRYRTPYICDEPPDSKHPNSIDELQLHIDTMAELAQEKGFKPKDVITYQESTKHYIDEVDKFYEVNREKIPAGFFLLGERMTYSSNRAPNNIILTSANNMHIFSAFNDNNDLVNFYRCMRKNIELQGDADILINSQVNDLHYLCELDKETDQTILSLSSEKISTELLFRTVYKPIFDKRVENGEKERPLYIILIGWDKGMGFGIDKDYNLVGDFTVMLQTCGEFNIHFIFICSGVGEIPASVIGACRYRIAGKISEDDSYKVVDSKVASKVFDDMKNGYMYIYQNGECVRAKIYQSKLEREVKKTELVL